MKVKVGKILKFVGIGFGTLLIIGYSYLKITDTRSGPRPKPFGTSTSGIAENKTTIQSKETAKKLAGKIVKKDQTAFAAPVIPAIPVINRVLPDKEIELSGTKIAPEESPIAFKGSVIRAEYCWVREKPERVIKNVPCINGFMDLTDYGLAEIKANIKVSKNEKGEDCVFLFDENDKEVEFKYVPSLGDMFGRQTGPTLKIFAIGIMKTEEPYFIVMECTNALEKGGEGKISLNPVANFVKKNKVRQVLEELYLAKENIDLLFPSEKVAQLK